MWMVILSATLGMVTMTIPSGGHFYQISTLRTLASATTQMRTLWTRLVVPTTAIGMSQIPAGKNGSPVLNYDYNGVNCVYNDGSVYHNGITRSYGRTLRFYMSSILL